jgi:acyl-CoA thioesterase 8
MHCYFVLAGNSEIPVIYHVERVRDGKSFATRTVQARQHGKVIFTTTMSFVKEGTGGQKKVEHAAKKPDVPFPNEQGSLRSQGGEEGPFESQRLEILNREYDSNTIKSLRVNQRKDDSVDPTTKKTRYWIRAKGRISPKGSHEAHSSALAYMSDSLFIGTVARVHGLWRWSSTRTDNKRSTVDEEALKKLLSMDDEKLRTIPGMDDNMIQRLRSGELPSRNEYRPTIGMMVSLDHTIYFHNPRDFRADEWMFTEMETPWAGDGRGLVFQKMFTRDGKLIATCVQEVGEVAS